MVKSDARLTFPRGAVLLALGLAVSVWWALLDRTAAAQEPPRARAHAIRSAPAAPGILYGATRLGLLISPDNGRSWRQLPIGGSDAEVFDVAAHKAAIIAARRDGLWRTDTAGRSWKQLRPPTLEDSIPVLLSQSESRPDTLLVATARHGVFRTDNGGRTWRRADGGLPLGRPNGRPVQLRALAIDPRDPNDAVAVHEALGAFKTTNGGEDWTPVLKGLPLTDVRPLSSYLPALVYGPRDVPFLAFSQPIHSHLVQSRLYRLDGNTWIPVSIELPDNQPVVGATFDHLTQALTIWTDESALVVTAEELTR